MSVSVEKDVEVSSTPFSTDTDMFLMPIGNAALKGLKNRDIMRVLDGKTYMECLYT